MFCTSKLPTIPQYWHDYVEPSIDLAQNPKQPCPFHHETHGKSFSYSEERGYFSCFGACHIYGGDVVRLHMLNTGIKTYKEAKLSLQRLYNITETTCIKIKPHLSLCSIDDEAINQRVLYAKACSKASTIKDWVRLDYLMSQYPVNYAALEIFCSED